MKALKIVSVLALAVLWAGAAFAQDPVKVDAKHYKVLVDNPSVRVLKITYPAGDKSPMHQHPDAMVVPLVNVQGSVHDAGRQNAGPGVAQRIGVVHTGGNTQPGERRLGAHRGDSRRVQVGCARHGDRAHGSSRIGNKGPRRKPEGDRLSSR